MNARVFDVVKHRTSILGGAVPNHQHLIRLGELRQHGRDRLGEKIGAIPDRDDDARDGQHAVL